MSVKKNAPTNWTETKSKNLKINPATKHTYYKY